MQSLVPSLFLNNLIPLTIIFSSVYLHLNKKKPLRIGSNCTPPDWQQHDPSGLAKKYPSGLAKTVPLWIGKNSAPTDWQKQYPSELAKIVPLRTGKIGTPSDWQNWDPSGLAKLGPLRIGKIGTPPDWQSWDPFDWQKWDPSGLAKLGPHRIGKIGTPPDSYPSAFVKIAFQRLSNFSPDTLPDTFSDAIMLFELTRKGVISFPRPFRIEAKPLI